MFLLVALVKSRGCDNNTFSRSMSVFFNLQRCPEDASKSVSQSTDNRSANQDKLKV